MMSADRPIIGVTMGDPAGIGPEISIKALSKFELYDLCKPIIIGDLGILEKTREKLDLNVQFRIVNSPSESIGKAGIIEVIDLKNIDLNSFRLGKASAEGGRASIEYIEKAAYLALHGEINAVTTCPINKQAISMAGSPYIGHTEMLAALCDVKDPLVMFWVRGVRIFFLTRHIPLSRAIQAVKKDRIIKVVTRIVSELHRLGLNKPTIAVAALNPHASDRGLIGDEEEKEILPAVEELKSKGFNVVGPVPADSIFHKAFEGRYDAVLSLYHDQGHIAAKTADFFGTVSVTLGLPFIRTSVDHGTAYDIVGKGIANSKSLEEAIKVAAYLSRDLKNER
ncbi:4-hydroxythreonine-4-phosphate dehydrogenase PdxA [Candidatus Bathyarchaeota archaeon]|nr:MAG: 4-hydroxythreonine-4-phosphate dehydrogenase PdxA [Candidatus Bathyarchaeota archaeon]